MLFAFFGLGLPELIVLGLCCGALGIVVVAIVVVMFFLGKRSADPDDAKKNRDEKARREQSGDEAGEPEADDGE